MPRSDKIITYWLLTGCILIATMVIIGGITRLTHSGLSIVDWRPIMGTLPPFSQEEWQQTFDKYKTSPEFKMVNSTFTVEEFKTIFWWEYIHRLLGRITGLIFIVPFVFFLIKKWLNKKLLIQSITILILGGLQGVLGWYMVKSGLVKNPNVSHYRLAAHLITALTAFLYTFWVALDIIFKDRKFIVPVSFKNWSLGLMALLILQIIYGALVAGLKGGLHYNTFPKMNGKWIHPSISKGFSDMGLISIFENIATVQFIHRYLGIFIGIGAIWMFFKFKKSGVDILSDSMAKKGLNAMVTMTIIQITLGIITLLYHVPVTIGVIHQFGALILLTIIIHNIYISSTRIKTS